MENRRGKAQNATGTACLDLSWFCLAPLALSFNHGELTLIHLSSDITTQRMEVETTENNRMGLHIRFPVNNSTCSLFDERWNVGSSPRFASNQPPIFSI
jgi:hypothetical protein